MAQNNPGLFEVCNENVTVKFLTSNDENEFSANFMCDGDVDTELALPAQKIIQLGLRPYKSKCQKYKDATNRDRTLTMFKPAVEVKLFFCRNDGGATVERSALLLVTCPQEDYDDAVRTSQVVVNSIDDIIPIGSKRTSSEVSGECRGVAVPMTLTLSPVAHRPPSDSNMRVVLGTAGLKKLYVRANFIKSTLEIVEEVIYEG